MLRIKDFSKTKVSYQKIQKVGYRNIFQTFDKFDNMFIGL